uniref:Uncharacterized protein n=1 Tax=Proboscia inermis TaxID=420281 RepID=A0A7S0CGW0_9STRA|mmetsp:Transcript_47162/g.47596  ORF Transcript_47162/g.47596 Transcript_47162/m.47596 type:complete len:105 (+) Transcript_47162:73-387(+)
MCDTNCTSNTTARVKLFSEVLYATIHICTLRTTLSIYHKTPYSVIHASVVHSTIDATTETSINVHAVHKTAANVYPAAAVPKHGHTNINPIQINQFIDFFTLFG